MRKPGGRFAGAPPKPPAERATACARMGRGRRHAASPIASLNAARECAKAASPQRRARPRPCPPAGDLGQSRGKPTSPPCTVARPCPSQAVNRCLPTARARLDFLAKTRLKDSGAALRAPVTFAPPPHRTAARLILRREHRRHCNPRPRLWRASVVPRGWPSMPARFPFCMGRSVCLRVYPKGHDLSLTRREEIKMM